MISSPSELLQQVNCDLKDKYLFGHATLLESLVVAYLARGHVLVEGPPGTSKTMTARLLAKLLAKKFRRIQFTSDLLPSDIIGSHIYSQAKSDFVFIEGPIFADVILADEINRTPPRTQSALLEAMEERQVTAEGSLMKLSPDFFVVATQNPQDYEGTFPLPEVQLDRFLLKITLQHSPAEVEVKILEQFLSGVLPVDEGKIPSLQIDRSRIDSTIASIRCDPSLIRWITQLLQKTRTSPHVAVGSSLRGGLALFKCAQVWACLQGREFITPDDLKRFVVPSLRHRIKLSPEAQLNQVSESSLLEELMQQVPFPT